MNNLTTKEVQQFNEKLQVLLDQCIEELKKLRIPITEGTIVIKTNTRAKTRFGCCRQIKKDMLRKYYVIEVASILDSVEDKKVKEVIIHELLHTCKGCQNHGKIWKKYIAVVNSNTDYNITVTVDFGYFNLDKPQMTESSKYKIVCQKCGTTTYRKRQCRLVQYPANYRCMKCGGSLKVLDLE